MVEFDDAVVSAPFVSSKKAHAEIARLRAKYRMAFGHNPGGMYFEYEGPPHFSIQIGGNDDIEDCNTVRNALIAHGLSVE